MDYYCDVDADVKIVKPNRIYFCTGCMVFHVLQSAHLDVCISQNILFFNREFHFKMTIKVVWLSRYIKRQTGLKRGMELITFTTSQATS